MAFCEKQLNNKGISVAFMKLVIITKMIILFLSFYLFCFSLPATANTENMLLVGAEQVEQYLPELKGKKVGLVVNQTSAVFN